MLVCDHLHNSDVLVEEAVECNLETLDFHVVRFARYVPFVHYHHSQNLQGVMVHECVCRVCGTVAWTVIAGIPCQTEVPYEYGILAMKREGHGQKHPNFNVTFTVYFHNFSSITHVCNTCMWVNEKNGNTRSPQITTSRP